MRGGEPDSVLIETCPNEVDVSERLPEQFDVKNFNFIV